MMFSSSCTSLGSDDAVRASTATRCNERFLPLQATDVQSGPAVQGMVPEMALTGGVFVIIEENLNIGGRGLPHREVGFHPMQYLQRRPIPNLENINALNTGILKGEIT